MKTVAQLNISADYVAHCFQNSYTNSMIWRQAS